MNEKKKSAAIFLLNRPKYHFFFFFVPDLQWFCCLWYPILILYFGFQILSDKFPAQFYSHKVNIMRNRSNTNRLYRKLCCICIFPFNCFSRFFAYQATRLFHVNYKNNKHSSDAYFCIVGNIFFHFKSIF